MNIKVLGWRYENIRGGLRDIEIDLGLSPPRLALIQMPNGTGKTTTMELLRALLSARRLTADEVYALRSSDNDVRGSFELRLLVSDELYRLEVRLDFEARTASYHTSRAQISVGGQEPGLHLPTELRRLFTPEFVRLFVFDGELAKQIRDLSQEHATAAIRTLYRLNRLADLRSAVHRLIEAEQNSASGSRAMEMRGITRLRNNVDEAQNIRDGLAHALRDQRSRFSRLEAESRELEVLRTAQMEKDDDVRVRMQSTSLELETCNSEILVRTKRVLTEMRSPAIVHPRLLSRLQELGSKLERLKLPQTMSSEFFQELAAEAECVCGRPITDVESRAILDRASRYLAENQIAVINAMKLAVRNSGTDTSEVATLLISLKELVRNRQILNQQRDSLNADLVAAGDEELQRLNARLGEVTRDVEALSREIEKISSKDKSVQLSRKADWRTNLPLSEAELEARQQRLATATNTRQFLLQGRLVVGVIERIETAILTRLRERVRLATNAKLASLVKSEPLQISRIDGALVLESGKLGSKAGVSEGQSLAVAYAFLTSLFQDAPFRLPFIVDSPAVSLDTRVRREVATILPELFEQLIMFVISSEREGFAESFYTRGDAMLLTVWQEGETTEMRSGRDAFEAFHGVEEAGLGQSGTGGSSEPMRDRS